MGLELGGIIMCIRKTDFAGRLSIIAILLVFLSAGSIFAATPVSWWKLDDTSGTAVADSSGSGHAGTVAGTGVVWSPAAGFIGGAVNFDASIANSNTGRVGVPLTGMSSTAGTISFWTKLNEPQHRTSRPVVYLFGVNQGGTGSAKLNLQMSSSDTKLDLTIGATIANDMAVLNTAAWYHIALTWNGANCTAYVNGGSITKSGTYVALTALGGYAHIGNNGQTGAGVAPMALIDNVLFWSQDLTAGQVQTVYENCAFGIPGQASDPSPADGATGVSTDADLIWTAGSGTGPWVKTLVLHVSRADLAGRRQCPGLEVQRPTSAPTRVGRANWGSFRRRPGRLAGAVYALSKRALVCRLLSRSS